MKKRLALIFPGQGSQTLEMGRNFYENSGFAREVFDAGSEIVGKDFKDILFENKNDLLNQTEYTQPAIMAISLVAHNLLIDGLNNDADIELMMGHSLGELTAVVASLNMNYVTALQLAHNRGKFMSEACKGLDASMMVILGLDDKIVVSECDKLNKEGYEIYPANFNCNGQIVLAGKRADLDRSTDKFKVLGAKRAMLLNMSVASHCPLLEPATAQLNEELKKHVKSDLSTKVLSNVTANYYTTKDDAIDLLTKQLVKPVRYSDCIKEAEKDIDMFVELGNGSVLKGLNKKITEKNTMNIYDMDSLGEVLKVAF